MALLVLVFSARLGTIPSWSEVNLLANPWLWPATTPLPFLFGPLLWWYARELSAEGPAAPVLLPIRNGMKVLLNVFYIVLAARIAFGEAARSLSTAHRQWLRALVVVPAGVLVAFGFVAVNPAATARLAAGEATPFIILAAAMSLLLYTFSMLVLIAPSGLARHGIPLGFRSVPVLSEEECHRLADLVRQKLDEGAFLDPDLSLADLASRLEVHANRLSIAVNRFYKAPFRTLLNRRRLDYFTDHAAQGALGRQTILDLAFEAGFPSKSTFNRVFKEETGLTPSEYAARVGAVANRL